MFSPRNREGLGAFKSLVIDASHAIYRYSAFGPTFGTGWDIFISNDANSDQYSRTDFGDDYSVPIGVQARYTILAGTYNFSPDDWEVFYLA